LFEAEGWESRSSGGLAGVAAAPYANALGAERHLLASSVVDPTSRSATASFALRGAKDAGVLHHAEGVGIVIRDDDDVVWGAAPGTHDVGRLVESAPRAPARAEDDRLVAARAASVAATRLALAFSLVGACRTLQARALAHSAEREQFGQPIGRFQAVRHLLATMVVETEAASDVCQIALTTRPETPDGVESARVAKALAGRSAIRVAQHALQIFGAAGFTWEHPHSELQRRVLVLDALYGSYEALSAAIGRSTDRARLLSFSQQVWTARTAGG